MSSGGEAVTEPGGVALTDEELAILSCYDIVQRASDTYAATDATAADNIETTGR